MRIRMTGLVAMLGLCLAASPAMASRIWVESNLPWTMDDPPIPVGGKVTVKLYLDATQTGIQLLSVGVLYDASILGYAPKPNSSVGVPTYILYGMSGMSSSALYAQHPTWLEWPGTKPPGMGQVNVNWADPTLKGTYVTGFNKIAELEFVVTSFGEGLFFDAIQISLTAGGNIFQVNGNPNTPIAIVYTPEPTIGVLVGLGLAGLALISRQRADQTVR